MLHDRMPPPPHVLRWLSRNALPRKHPAPNPRWALHPKVVEYSESHSTAHHKQPRQCAPTGAIPQDKKNAS